MNTKEAKLFLEEVKNLKGKLTEDELKQLYGEEYIKSADKKTPDPLPDQLLENVTGGGGIKDEFSSYLTAIYVCPKCNGAHAVRIYVGPIAMHPFWSNGCIDFSSRDYDVEWSPNSNLPVGELVSTRNGCDRYTFAVVSNTVKGETTWLL